MDLYSRKIIAWKVARNPNSILVLQTLEEAWKIRGKPEAVIFHSDRGTQYTSKMVREALSAKNFVQSFSQSGSPYDNAVAEAFFRYLKEKELNRRNFSCTEALRRVLFTYISERQMSKKPNFVGYI